MRPNQPRQKCECGLTFRYDSDFQEHKRVGCVVKSGEGESLSPDPDEALNEEFIAEALAETEPLAEKPKKQGRKK